MVKHSRQPNHSELIIRKSLPSCSNISTFHYSFPYISIQFTTQFFFFSSFLGFRKCKRALISTGRLEKGYKGFRQGPHSVPETRLRELVTIVVLGTAIWYRLRGLEWHVRAAIGLGWTGVTATGLPCPAGKSGGGTTQTRRYWGEHWGLGRLEA